MPATPPTDRETAHLVREAIVDALRASVTEGAYPCPDKGLKDRVVAALRGRVPARGLRGAIGRILVDVAVRDRPRAGEPWRIVLAGDEARLYDVAGGEIVDAVEALRTERAYPATLPAVAKRLRLTPRGRQLLADRMLEGEVPDGLSLIHVGKRRTPKLTVRGEEDFDRALKKKEQLDLRIRLADVEGPRAGASPVATTTEDAPTFRAEIDSAYDRLSAEERTRFVTLPRLRAALPDRDRETFDRELVALCEADLYQLSEHEHAYRLTPQERNGTLDWGGRAYYFVSRV